MVDIMRYRSHIRAVYSINHFMAPNLGVRGVSALNIFRYIV